MTYAEMKKILSMAENPVDRLELVMDFGAQMPPIPADALCSEITGCASRVEICQSGGKFYGAADSALVRGIVAILLAMVDGKVPDEIRKMNLYGEFMSLNLPLGAGRVNGLNSMIRFLQNL